MNPQLSQIQSVVSVVAVDRKSTRLNSSHTVISYAVFCLKKKKKNKSTVISQYIIANTTFKPKSKKYESKQNKNNDTEVLRKNFNADQKRLNVIQIRVLRI